MRAAGADCVPKVSARVVLLRVLHPAHSAEVTDSPLHAALAGHITWHLCFCAASAHTTLCVQLGRRSDSDPWLTARIRPWGRPLLSVSAAPLDAHQQLLHVCYRRKAQRPPGATWFTGAAHLAAVRHLLLRHVQRRPPVSWRQPRATRRKLATGRRRRRYRRT